MGIKEGSRKRETGGNKERKLGGRE